MRSLPVHPAKSALLAACWHGLAIAQGVNVLSEPERSQGFVSLFDGTMDSFRARFADYIQDDSVGTGLDPAWSLDVLHQAVSHPGNGIDIRSRAIYGDFDFRLDYRNSMNAGIYYRFTTAGLWAWYTGVEYSIYDLTDTSLWSPGAAFGLFPPQPNAYRPYATGEWNSVRIVAVDDSVEHWMNGVLVVGFRYHNERWWEAYDRSKWIDSSQMGFRVKGCRTCGYIEAGHIGFQADHGGAWLIRNLRINAVNPRLGPPGGNPSAVISLRRGKRGDFRLQREAGVLSVFPGGPWRRTLDGRAFPIPRIEWGPLEKKRK